MATQRQKTQSEDAQASGAQTTGQTLSSSVDVSKLAAARNAEAFMTTFQNSDVDVIPEYPSWKDDEFKKYFRTRFFRHDEVQKLGRQIAAEKFVQATRDGSIMDIKFTDIFHESNFHEDDGTISQGSVKDTHKGCTIKEMIMFVQPIGAYNALMKMRIDRSGAYVNPKERAKELNKRALAHAHKAGARSGDTVKITEAELGTEDDPADWNALER